MMAKKTNVRLAVGEGFSLRSWFFSPKGLLLAGLAIFGSSLFLYNECRIDVGTGEMAVLIRKTGLDLKTADEIAPTAAHKGVQRDLLTEGRYFKNPYDYTWRVLTQTSIPEGKLGVLISLTGDDLPYGEFLARTENGVVETKGIVPDVLRPGRYPINPYLFNVELRDPVTIQAGLQGVVTNLAGPMPKEPNTLLVKPGERGVQEQTLEPGTYYLNPYVTRVNLVDCRSQRFNLDEDGEMGFPSKDGFWVSLDGIIEFRVDPKKAAEVYVIYNEIANGELIDEELVRKVIMPNARSFCRLQGSNELGREFIQGVARTKFQEDFQTAMQHACAPLGIDVIQALITKIRPPEQIATPVRKREIAKQQELQYKQQIKQQLSEQKLAIEKALVEQKQALVRADQEVVKLTTEAKQFQQVAVTLAEQQLAVAQLKLEAAKDEAAAITARGQAEADVVRFQNEAEVAGWKTAVDAFDGDGQMFAQFVMYEKLSSAYRKLMVNTGDSPIMKVFESFTPGTISPASKTAKSQPASPPTAPQP
jgi:regulator of protease activity HflC (stomatin/prohibitin superfamily)